MSKIKKVVITEFGDESKLAIVEADLPDPAAREVQVAVDYSIVAGSDVNMRRGTYPFQKKAPLTPGYSILGKVLLNGKGCSTFQAGDRVACLTKYEAQAERINLPEQPPAPLHRPPLGPHPENYCRPVPPRPRHERLHLPRRLKRASKKQGQAHSRPRRPDPP